MPKVLIVDDEAIVRQSVAMVFSMKGWQVETAANGQEALEKGHGDRPQVIICDLDMPVMDGFRTLEAVRVDPQMKGVPFIAISGRLGEDYETRIMELGAQGFLLKPFAVDDLLALVSQVMVRGGVDHQP